MPPRVTDDWSDSDDDQSVSEIETSVLLGIPDGEINEPLDLSDPAVSRIGGLPAFLPARPLARSSSYCMVCARPMPLLVQMWCPFEGSAMDRALYVWGCERPACQLKDGSTRLHQTCIFITFCGAYKSFMNEYLTDQECMKASIRVWRGLKFNPKYAAKLAQKKAREAEMMAKEVADKARIAAEKKTRSVNPFTLSASTSTEMAFGLGSQLFGSAVPAQVDVEDQDSVSSSVNSDSEDEEGDDRDIGVVVQQLENTTLEPVALQIEWSSSPAYKPIYLSTISECLPRGPTSKIKRQSLIDERAEDDDKNHGKDWSLEDWEQSVAMDGVFERFVKRVSSENEQCVRYDLKGIPLPFGSRDKVYDRFWPPPPPVPFTTKPDFAAPIIQRRAYNASSLVNCGACGGPRVFECQLMPNLINVLRAQGNPPRDRDQDGDDDSQNRSRAPQTAEEQKKMELEMALNDGMGWGTCFIFSCEKDCCPEGDNGWMEELVLVQWDV